MKRLLSRHVVVVVLVLITSVLGGLSVAVVAFGQASSSDPDATVPAGDYTGTTPAPPTSGYTVPATTPTVSTVTTPAGRTTPTRPGTVTGSSGRPTGAHGATDVSIPSGQQSAELPSRTTGRAPTKLAFTGGEPLLIGGFGVALMLTGVALQERRRRRAAGEL